jgi:dipeptidyl aminopeptidase/acylaminoacyl peptidase
VTAVQHNRIVRIVSVITAATVLAGCAGNKRAESPSPTGPDAAHKPALFYAKDGALYVSDPAGTPGRKLTDGPADTDPAPSPDGSRVAFVRKASRADGGGELWVLDLSAGSAPASAPRRLVDPAALVPTFPGDNPAKSTLDSPRWSPAGDRIAFLKTGGGGGFLLTAAADTGAVQAPPRPLYADRNYSWAPDGKRIAWAGGRMDVSPVDVSVLTLGGASQPVATGTDAASVVYADGGRSILFANGDATGSLFSAIPFTLRGGGIYSVEPPAAPRPVLSGAASYGEVASLWRGAIGFTQWSADQRTKTIQVLPQGGSPHRIADTRGDSPSPEWAGDTVAYIGTADDRPLMIATDRDPGKDGQADRKDQKEQEAQQLDVGVEAFAWGD